MKSILELAKSIGETWFEHSKNTYHLGRVLWKLCKKEIRKYFSEDEYLWCCLFHDIGKLLWQGFDDNHTPYTEKAISVFSEQKDYKNLLKQFNLPDLSANQKLISVIRDHHDNKVKGSELITLADCIASSDYGYLSELDTSNYSNYLRFLISDLHELKGYYLIKINFPESSYLDRVKFGQIFLTKMLREAVWKMCAEDSDLHYLFDIQNGCKILSKIEPTGLKGRIDETFKLYLLDRFKDFDLLQLIGGQPQSTFRLRQYVFPQRYDLVQQTLFKACLIETLGNISRSGKIKEIQHQYEMAMWTTDELVEKISQYVGWTKEALKKFLEYDSGWLGYENSDKTLLTKSIEELNKGKVKSSVKDRISNIGKIVYEDLKNKPVMLSILRKEGLIDSTTKYIECLIEPFAKYFIRKNSFLRRDESYPDIEMEPLLSFLSLSNQLPVSVYAKGRNEVCASCGTFIKYLEAGPIVTGFSKQQWREAIGMPESPQPLCALCYFSLLTYTYLTGTEKGQNIRPLDAMYITLIGVNILKDVEEFIQGQSLFSEEVTKRLENFKKQFKYQKVIVYTPHEIDLDMIVYSIIPKTDTYRDYPSIQKYSILSEIRDLIQSSENILGVAIQNKPEIKGSTLIKTQEGEIDLTKIDETLNLFNFIRDITYDPKTLIVYFRLWQQNPVLALSKIIKDSNSNKKVYISQENLRKGLEMIPKNDLFFQLAQQLWQTVSLLGQLSSGWGSKYEIGKPVKKFKGTPGSLDYHMNYLLKDTKCSQENKANALKLASDLRDKLSKLSSKEQRELGNYVKKTTHLFSALAWQEIKTQKGEKENERAK